MTIFRIGPDGLLLIQALLVSIVVAALAWRRAALSSAAISTAVVAMACGIWLARLPDTSHPVLAALFVIVPSALLLGASRVRWIAITRGCCCSRDRSLHRLHAESAVLCQSQAI